MWIMTPSGAFLSVVQKHGDDDLTVRGRVRGDLDELAGALGGRAIDSESGTDYAYRLRCTREEWAAVLAAMAADVTYDNYKTEVKLRQGAERAAAYMRVWIALFDLQPPREPRWYGGYEDDPTTVDLEEAAWVDDYRLDDEGANT